MDRTLERIPAGRARRGQAKMKTKVRPPAQIHISLSILRKFFGLSSSEISSICKKVQFPVTSSAKRYSFL
jgi:hypothetical protein